MGYRIRLKDGYVDTDAHGQVIRFSNNGRTYCKRPSATWMILGIGTRHTSRHLVSLSAAAGGASIGQGWVHDRDHGTHRMWAMPTSRRAVSVEAMP